MFKLTEEQINYIIEVYGGSEPIIRDIERRLNLLGVVIDEDDYYEIVATVAAQKETIKEQIKKCTTKDQAMRKWVSTDSLIKYALNEKYNNFLNASPETQKIIRNFR
jgi:thiamine biosynthesis lipoprotein ApbE